MASDEATAVAEVRPWKGAKVTVAECAVKEELRFVNLMEITKPIASPFQYGENLLWEFNKRSIVYRLAEELKRPVGPGESELEYVPTQYLTEVIRAAGYDGMIYPSAMGVGHNLVVFDPSKVEILRVSLKEVNDIQYIFADPTEPWV